MRLQPNCRGFLDAIRSCAADSGSMPKFAVALVLAALTVVTVSSAASAERTEFALAFENGSFSAAPPLCETGDAVDGERLVANGLLTALRRLECGDGRGSVVARTWALGRDPGWGYPEWGYEEGAWQIVEGAGDFERLRGKGTYARVLLDDGATYEVWRGVADFDDIPPQVVVRELSVKKRPDGAHVARVVFSARDASGGPVSYLVAAKSSTLLAAAYGIARPGMTSVALRVRPRAGERSVRVEIEATDQVGNERAIVRVRALRGAP